MYCLMIGPRLIPTDLMIFKGSEYLLRQAGFKIDEYLTIEDHNLWDLVPKHEPTHIIVLGTPWVWDRCWESHKFKNVVKLFDRYPSAKRMFFGVGSCLPLMKVDEVKANLISNQDKLAIFKNATLITRDILATEILAPFSPTPLPCPAYYAISKGAVTSNSYPTMFWYDPTDGISQVDYGPRSIMLKNYLQKCYDEVESRKPIVYCITEAEQKSAFLAGIEKCTRVTGYAMAKFIIQHARTIWSGRVHMAVPAYVLNKAIHLEPVDTRHTVLSDVEKGLIISPWKAINVHKEILTEFMRSVPVD